MAEKSDLKVIKKKNGELDVVKKDHPKDVQMEAVNPKLTKAEQKKADKAKKKQIAEQAEAQAKAMEGSILAMGKAVKESACNTCVHCINPNKKFDRFKVTSSKGNELYTPMNFCKLAGMSMVDIKTCELFEEVSK